MKDKNTLSELEISDFEKTIEGKNTSLCVLRNDSGTEVAITNYGAKIVSIMVKDRNGDFVDVVTGHQTIDGYLTSEEPYFGAVCGRYGNRIAKGRFVLDGIVYDRLAINNGPNNLHGGLKGFNAAVWDMKQVDSRTVELYHTSPDGEEGFPGKLDVQVIYHLEASDKVVVTYRAKTDRPTVLNLTNHSYFNLSGAGDPSIYDHLLQINADTYLPVDETAIPYGDPAKVEGTPMDFRVEYPVGERIDDDFEQLRFGCGYDHTYILNDSETDDDLCFCARCYSPKTGIIMNVHTTEPGVQLYTGNWMTGNLIGKHGRHYPKRSALCLETQHFPDSPNKPQYPSTVLRPGENFESTTVFAFSNDNK